MSAKHKRSTIGGQFFAHRLEMKESLAWQYLSDDGRRLLDRLETEHMRHGAAKNGDLICTYSDFERVGIRRSSIAQIVRECVGLGFLKQDDGPDRRVEADHDGR